MEGKTRKTSSKGRSTTHSRIRNARCSVMPTACKSVGFRGSWMDDNVQMCFKRTPRIPQQLTRKGSVQLESAQSKTQDTSIKFYSLNPTPNPNPKL